MRENQHRHRKLMGWQMSAALLATVATLACGSTSQAADLSKHLESTLEELRIRHAFPRARAAIALPDGTVASAAAGWPRPRQIWCDGDNCC